MCIVQCYLSLEENNMFKKISAIAAAAVIAASMSVSAYATTYQDAVDAAKAAGVQTLNVQQLDNFLQPNSDCFTSEEYDDMISVLNGVRDKYVAPYCKGGSKQIFDKTPGELTEEDKIVLGRNWTEAEKQDIQKTLIDLGAKYDVQITITQDDKAHYTVAAEIDLAKRPHRGNDSGNQKGEGDSNKDKNSSSKGSGTTSSKASGGTQTKTDNPVASTGAEEQSSNGAAAAVAAVTLALAGFGVAVVAKKNKA